MPCPALGSFGNFGSEIQTGDSTSALISKSGNQLVMTISTASLVDYHFGSEIQTWELTSALISKSGNQLVML